MMDDRTGTNTPAMEAVLRPHGQVTLPAWGRDALGLKAGDRLTISGSDRGVLLRPRRAAALEALQEIQAAFATADVTEDELQEVGLQVREELNGVGRGAA